jgi:uncharacterized membrane protein SpoIIM required for sporulation
MQVTEQFVLQRKRDWERLETLSAQGRKKQIAALSADEIIELGHLYRRASADLALARRDYPQERVTSYLNQLVAQAHTLVYQAEAGEWRGMIGFFKAGFPQLFRQTWRFTAVSCAIFMLAAIAGFLALVLSPDSSSYMIPQGVADSVNSNRMWTEEEQSASLMSTYIMTNNIKVAILSFAGGIAFGLGSFYVLAMNGLLNGAVLGFCQTHGFGLRLFSFMAPHGIIELSVIFIVSGAGLQIGYALLRPGLLTRREALTVASQRVVRLLLGCIPLLVIAGLIEGFISPTPLLPEVKFAVSAFTGIVLYSYLILTGRKPAQM